MDGIRIQGLADARVALANAAKTGSRAVLIAPAAAGVAWCAEIADMLALEFPDTLENIVLDCGTDTALAFEALRADLEAIAYDGPHAQAVAALAARCGAQFRG
jgi:hypothetical protein